MGVDLERPDAEHRLCAAVAPEFCASTHDPHANVHIPFSFCAFGFNIISILRTGSPS